MTRWAARAKGDLTGRAAGLALLLMLAMPACGGPPSGPPPGCVPRPGGPPVAYVASTTTTGYETGNTLVPVNTVTGRPCPAITLHGTDGTFLTVVITPDGKTAYVISAYGRVIPVTTATGSPGRPLRLPGIIDGAAISPDSATLYLTLTHVRGGGPGAVIPVPTATNTPAQPIRLPFPPASAVISPDGRTLYVLTGNHLIPIHVTTGTRGKRVKIGSAAPVSIAPTTVGLVSGPPMAITPDGKTIYIAVNDFPIPPPELSLANPVAVIPVHTATGTPGKPFHVKGTVEGIAVTQNSKTAYILSSPNTLTPINTATSTPGNPLHFSLFTDPRTHLVISIEGEHIAATPDGTTLYITATVGQEFPADVGVVIAIHPTTRRVQHLFSLPTAEGTGFGQVNLR